MSFRVRSSKFRHVFGTALKREQCYDNIRVSKSTWDSTFCAVNPKFVAIITEAGGGGAFLVLPLHKVGRIERDYPLVSGHRGPVLDIAWCPFNDCVVASSAEDCVVRIWQVPENGLNRSLTEPVVELCMHQRRVHQIQWHPSANNILLSVGGDNHVIIWNVGTGEALTDIDCHPDVIYNACWNVNGSRLLTACKDKKLRIINPRTGHVYKEAIGHEGAKPMRAIYLKDNTIFTTGFSRMSERQYALHDEEGLGEPAIMVELDTSNGVMFPLYDPDTNMIYLCGKGDSVIRYFEVTDEAPFVHYINTFQSPEPQRGIGLMPKRGCDLSINEIARFYRLQAKGYCEVISMTVPRKSELFQDDLYPDTQGDIPAISADEWFAGKDADPIMVSLKDGFIPTKKNEILKVAKKSNILDKMPTKKAQASSESAPDSPIAISAPPVIVEAKPDPRIDDLLCDIRLLKATILRHESRIRELEAHLGIGVGAAKAKEAAAAARHNSETDASGEPETKNGAASDSELNRRKSPSPVADPPDLAPDEV